MALLRIKTPEQLSEQAPGELGRPLGLDRAPEVKTLRRRLEELGERDLAHTLAAQLAERWAQDAHPGPPDQPFHARHDDEARKLLKAIFQATAANHLNRERRALSVWRDLAVRARL